MPMGQLAFYSISGGSTLCAKEGARFYFTCPAGFSSFSHFLFFYPPPKVRRAPCLDPSRSIELYTTYRLYSSIPSNGLINFLSGDAFLLTSLSRLQILMLYTYVDIIVQQTLMAMFSPSKLNSSI